MCSIDDLTEKQILATTLVRNFDQKNVIRLSLVNCVDVEPVTSVEIAHDAINSKTHQPYLISVREKNAHFKTITCVFCGFCEIPSELRFSSSFNRSEGIPNTTFSSLMLENQL